MRSLVGNLLLSRLVSHRAHLRSNPRANRVVDHLVCLPHILLLSRLLCRALYLVISPPMYLLGILRALHRACRQVSLAEDHRTSLVGSLVGSLLLSRLVNRRGHLLSSPPASQVVIRLVCLLLSLLLIRPCGLLVDPLVIQALNPLDNQL